MTRLESPPKIYDRSVAGAEFRLAQGEFISDLVHAHILFSTLGTTEIRLTEQKHPYALVLSQGCDLEQDFRARHDQVKPDKMVPTVLFCEVELATYLRTYVQHSDIWNRIKINSHERYHFFQKADKEDDAASEGLPELGVDFKRFFAIPTEEVYHRIKSGEAKRRCCLRSPYLEHFCHRFVNFLSRVALPEPHSSDKENR